MIPSEYLKKNWTPIVLPFSSAKKKQIIIKPHSRPHSPKLNESTPGLQPELNYSSNFWNEIRIPSKIFSRRSYHTSVVYNKRIYIYGGCDLNSGVLGDFLQIFYDGEKFSKWELVSDEDPKSPGFICRHIAFVFENKMYTFGGRKQSIHNTNDMFFFNFDDLSWDRIAKPSPCFTSGKNFNWPPSIDSHQACLNEKTGVVYIMGGYLGDEYGYFTNRVFQFEIRTKKWSEFDTTSTNGYGPAPRSDHAMILSEQKLFIFGGTNENKKFGDLWSFDTETSSWREIKVAGYKPSPRNGHSLLGFNEKYLILFGGFEDITYEKNDLNYFSLQENKWFCAEKESLRRRNLSNARLSNSITSRIISNQEFTLPKIETKAHHHSNSLGSIKYSPVKILPSKFIKSLNTKSSSKIKKRQTFRMERQSTSMSSMLISSDRVNLNELSIPQFQIDAKPSRSANSMRSIRKPTFLDNLKTIHPNSQSKNNKDNSYSTDTENRVRVIEAKKMMMLSEFEVDENLKNSLIFKSPTTELMKRAIQSVTNMPFAEDPNDQKKKRKLLTLESGKIVQPIFGRITGKRPCARDGHSAILVGHKMLVIGGDRHKMPFNDIFECDLHQALGKY